MLPLTGDGLAVPVQPWGDSVRLLAPEGGRPVGTLGTNCAFRRDALLAVGGFDPAFAYHLDESDVNRRLAQAFPQGLTAVVPGAEVIHGLEPGTSRASRGVPHDLCAVGRSTAIFAARHGGSADWLAAAQRRRLLRLMVAGLDKQIYLPALLAERRQARGLKLNYPESVALISAFVMDMDQPGVSTHRFEDPGFRPTGRGSIAMDRAFVPDTHRLGEGGKGFAMIMQEFDLTRTLIAFMALVCVLFAGNLWGLFEVPMPAAFSRDSSDSAR